jgi:YfiR/HmsC-like
MGFLEAMPRRVVRTSLLAVATLVCAQARAEDTSQRPSEYQVKAAFLYNFVKFVDWPATPAGKERPIELCVLGKDPFGGALEHVVEGKMVNGRLLTIRHIGDIAAARSCHVLFISVSEAGRVTAITRAVDAWGVLTVSEIDRFSERGGIITFLMEGQRVRFQINPKAAASAGLKISSKLLQLAVVRLEDKEKN